MLNITDFHSKTSNGFRVRKCAQAVKFAIKRNLLNSGS